MALTVNLVALPIGNVADLSPRASEALTQAHRIFCEDTRKMRELLKRADIQTNARLTALPGGSEHQFDWERARKEANVDERWVLVSDAGTPLVNDPGAELVEYCRRAQVELRATPGPCAPIAAWQWSGGFGLPFVFAGFAPKAKSPGTKDLDRFFEPLSNSGSFSYFDTKHQFATTLEHLVLRGLGDRPLFVAREMTKPHEQLHGGTVRSCLTELAERLQTEGQLGELTFLLKGEDKSSASGSVVTLDQLVQIRKASVKDAAKIAAELTGLSSRDCYQLFIGEKS